MPTTVEQVAADVLASIDTTAGLLLASRWVSDRYRRLAARVKMKHLRKLTVSYVAAPITAGQATATTGSTLVTGDATAAAAWAPTDVVGMYFRLAVSWYQVVGTTQVAGATALTLEKPFAELNASNQPATLTSGYTLLNRFALFDPDIRWLGETLVHQRTRKRLDRTSMDEMDVLFPARHRVGSMPEAWAEVGDRIAPAGPFQNAVCKAIEVYPYSTTPEIYNVIGYPTAPDIKLTDYLPPEIDPHVLKEGALIDAMRYESAMAMRNGQVEQAGYWRNEYRAQMTSWERHVMEAIRADKGADDLTFILTSPGFVRRDRDLVTAYDEVLARWPR